MININKLLQQINTIKLCLIFLKIYSIVTLMTIKFKYIPKILTQIITHKL